MKLGMEAKFYLGDSLITTAGDESGVDWTEVDNIQDLNLNLEKGEAEFNTRGNNGWTSRKPTLKNGTIEFNMRWDTDDANFTKLLEAWLNDNEVAAAAMDGDIETDGSQGFMSNFYVQNFSRNEALQSVISVDVTLVPSSKSDWLEVEVA